MESRGSYPRDYRRALKNTLTEKKLEELLQGSTPMFLFGPLMLPQVLKSVTDTEPGFDIAAHMTQASLLQHKLWIFEGVNIPVVMPSEELGQSVDGLLVFALNPEQRNWIYEFEAEITKEMTHVQVEVCMRDGNLRAVDAATFVWTGAMHGIVPAESRSWKIDTFLESEMYQNIAKNYDSS
ncbi:hypothetical protein PRK78_006642 [Emydomyces testavorans]|uniref:Gamma-glutamylcyclotransferase AIG2-like domain-containing protein n=1 Tax=Emydomyces testavorans TaxID=2070801 RepID=A0AAF0ILW9_9EURO|nr:hypothetical protein PRK78_006642 [Emydomyces testavorans]